MSIETLADWNKLLSCCCEMPSCPVPTLICSSIEQDLCGFTLPEDHPDVTPEELCQKYKKRRDRSRSVLSQDTITTGPFGEVRVVVLDDEDRSTVHERLLLGGVCTTRVFSTSRLDVDRIEQFNHPSGELIARDENTITSASAIGSPCSGTSVTVSETPPDPPTTDTSFEVDCIEVSNTIDDTWTRTGLLFTKTYVDLDGLTWTKEVEFSEPIIPSESLDGLEFPDDANGELCSAQTTCDNARKAQAQWQVPDVHGGTYFKVWFDVIEEPDGWDEEGGPLRSWYAEGVMREWTGPGENEQDDPSWLIGLPYEIPPPDVSGIRRIVNIRFECYRGPYGSLPQVIGEGVTL